MTVRLQKLAGKYLSPVTAVLWGTTALVVCARFALSSEATLLRDKLVTKLARLTTTAVRWVQ